MAKKVKKVKKAKIAREDHERLARAASRVWVAACDHAFSDHPLIAEAARKILLGKGRNGQPVPESMCEVWRCGLLGETFP